VGVHDARVGGRLAVSRRLCGLALVAPGPALPAALDAYVPAGPAFGLSALAAWLIAA
jgi:hypothetical protein